MENNENYRIIAQKLGKTAKRAQKNAWEQWPTKQKLQLVAKSYVRTAVVTLIVLFSNFSTT